MFAFEAIPRSESGGRVPLWFDEGLADYAAGTWSDTDQAILRGLVASGDLPAMSTAEGHAGFENPRVVYALGHAAFDFVATEWGQAAVGAFMHAFEPEGPTDRRSLPGRARNDAGGVRRRVRGLSSEPVRSDPVNRARWCHEGRGAPVAACRDCSPFADRARDFVPRNRASMPEHRPSGRRVRSRTYRAPGRPPSLAGARPRAGRR